VRQVAWGPAGAATGSEQQQVAVRVSVRARTSVRQGSDGGAGSDGGVFWKRVLETSVCAGSVCCWTRLLCAVFAVCVLRCKRACVAPPWRCTVAVHRGSARVAIQYNSSTQTTPDSNSTNDHNPSCYTTPRPHRAYPRQKQPIAATCTATIASVSSRGVACDWGDWARCTPRTAKTACVRVLQTPWQRTGGGGSGRLSRRRHQSPCMHALAHTPCTGRHAHRA
jgi:hypothetical protein